MAKNKQVKNGEWVVLKSVKGKANQKLVKLLKEENEQGLGGTLFTFGYYTTPRFEYGRKKWVAEKIIFYDKNGEVFKHSGVWSVNGFTSEHGRGYKAVSFASEVKKKLKPKFDGSVFFVSLGQDRIWEDWKAALYVPMTYLEALGYEVMEQTKEYKYRTDYEKIMRCPLLDITLETNTTHHVDKRLADLRKAIKKAKTKEDIAKALKECMDIYEVRVR